MKQFSLLSALCALVFVHSSLRAPVFKGNTTVSQSIQEANNALTIPKKMLDVIDSINSNDLPKITLDNLQNNAPVFKEAWEDLLEKLNTLKNKEKEYTKYKPTGSDLSKAKSKIISIQDKVVAFLNAVESAIEDEDTPLELRSKLLNAYDTLTKDWTANPYVIDAGYKSIILDLNKKVQGAEPQQAYVPQSIPRPAGMFRGAPDNRNKN